MSTDEGILAGPSDAGPIAPARRSAAAPVVAPPLWPVRVLALVGAAAQGWHELTRHDAGTIAGLASVVAYAGFATWRPIPYRDDRTVRIRIAIEMLLHATLVVGTGVWRSPFAVCLIPTGMLAGFAAGTTFSAQVVTAAAVAVSAREIASNGMDDGGRASLLWAALLGLVAFTSGLSHRAVTDAMRQQQVAMRRANQLAEANSLLFALQRVTQAMPTSLDLDEVVDTTLTRLAAMMPATAVALYVSSADTPDRLDLYRSRGATVRTPLGGDDLPAALQHALGAPRTAHVNHLAPGAGLSEGARSALYTGLRIRGGLIGALAVEADADDAFAPQHVEILHGLAETCAIAVDNARLFRRIRTVSAHDERRRLARDLHDQVGSSLAFLGFEIDRARALAVEGDDVVAVLDGLRSHLTDVIRDVRETLSDMRTEVTDERDLATTLRDHLARVERRSGIHHVLDVDVALRPPRRHEQELWQMALEAITNVERHARATNLVVRYRVTSERVLLDVADDGIGLNSGQPRADGYGMIGMRERADGIGARLVIAPNRPRGTRVSVALDLLDEAHA